MAPALRSTGSGKIQGQMQRGRQDNTGSEQERAPGREERGSPFRPKFNFSLLERPKLNLVSLTAVKN